MKLCREAAQNAETLTGYYSKGRKYKKLEAEARQQAAKAKCGLFICDFVVDYSQHLLQTAYEHKPAACGQTQLSLR